MFLIGFFIGAFVGIFTICLIISGDDHDDI